MRLLAAAAVAACLSACSSPFSHRLAVAAAPAEARSRIVILVGIDGARPDYITPAAAPVLSRLKAEGASAAMRPSFPTKTFPNFWTIATGLRPDRTGVVGNTMEDAARPGEKFTLASDDPFWWNGARPIWVAAEEAGVRSATMFWPGANVAWGATPDPDRPRRSVGGRRASDWQQFNQAVSPQQRVDAVLDWVRRPADNRPRFLTLYFDDVDSAGHQHGPSSPEARAAMRRVDAQIGRLVDGLAAMHQPADLVFVADHGMADTSTDRVVALDRIAPAADYRVIEAGPYASIEPVPGREAAVAAALSRSHPHMRCWPKAAIPQALHYGRNPRVPAWLCLGEIGWLVLPTTPRERDAGGSHGYDNHAPEMAALFVAHGPSFAHGTLASFDNVDIHPLLRRLLNLPADPTLDGSDRAFAPVLRP